MLSKNKKIFNVLLFFLSIGSFFIGANARAYGAPNYLPDGPHPRIWLTTDKLSQLRAKACVDISGNTLSNCTPAPEWTSFFNYISAYKTSGSYYNMQAWHFALAYVITKDVAYRDRAFQLTDPIAAEDIYQSCVNQATWATPRACYNNGLYGWFYMQDVATVYDWLYSDLGTTRKNNYLSYMHNFLDEWWNPAAIGYIEWAKEDPLNNYYWHHMFATALATVALYGDDNTPMTLVTNGLTYTNPLSFWNAKMVQVKSALDLWGSGGGWHEGQTYARSTFNTMFYSFLTLKSATGRDYFSDLAYPEEMGKFSLYAIQPDNSSLFPAADMPGGDRATLDYDNWRNINALTEGISGTNTGQYLQYWLKNISTPSIPGYESADQFMFFDNSRTAADPRATFPLGYYAPGYGFFNWRTAWYDNNAVSLSFISTDILSQHQHWNQNNFYLFYRGWQVSAANLYCSSGIDVDGHLENNYVIGGLGQYYPYKTAIRTTAGKVLAEEFDTSHGYVKGDATLAYTNKTNVNDPYPYDDGPLLLNNYYRSILTSGKYTVVYDRVSPKDASSPTEYYLHFSSQPTISGKTASVTNGSGMLFHTTLFPVSVNISSGLDSTWTQDCSGGYLKVAPQTQLADNYLLNVIEVTPSGTFSKTPTTLIDGINLRGAVINDASENEIMMFSANSLEVNSGSYAVTTTATSKHYVSDLSPNTQFDVTVDGNKITSTTSLDAGVLSFVNATTGTHTYMITRSGSVGTYLISDFISMITNWLHLEPISDFNSDNIVNAKDLGIMMSKWN